MARAVRWVATAAVLMGLVAGVPDAGAQATTAAAAAGSATATPDNAILLTVFPKHDQSRPLGELNRVLEDTAWEWPSTRKR